jgi:hypothetical protein
MNKYLGIFSFFILLQTHLNANESIATSILEKYKTYLEQGTYEGQDWSSFTIQPKSRYYTFKKAFEHFEKNNGKIIVELGTTRSFVHGGLPGCNSSDTCYWAPNNPERWDWGAGCFTRMAAECLAYVNPTIITIDIEIEHLQRCTVITAEFRNIIRYYRCSSEEYLNLCKPGIDLLYIDTGDITPLEPTAQLQLHEAEIIVKRDLISPDGIILIDDVRNQTPKKFGENSDLGKAKYSIPYFLDHGFEIIENEYQVMLRKKES